MAVALGLGLLFKLLLILLFISNFLIIIIIIYYYYVAKGNLGQVYLELMCRAGCRGLPCHMLACEH